MQNNTCKQYIFCTSCMLSPERHIDIWRLIRGPFLFPQKFPGHACEWERFSFTQAGCTLCGTEHRCAENGSCVEVHDDNGQITCTITGCVTREKEQRPEWGALDRTHTEKTKTTNSGHHRNSKQSSPCDTWLFVNNIVTEILNSTTTAKCRWQENKRLYIAQITTLHKEIKRQYEQYGCVNLVRVAATVAFQTRKLRRPTALPKSQLKQLITLCTDSVCKVVLKYNTQHTSKILNSESRKREFACSMLYLMRNGVSCRGECILPKIPIMENLLPLESFLPEEFKIRSKSITEGENLLKIEIRRVNKM